MHTLMHSTTAPALESDTNDEYESKELNTLNDKYFGGVPT